MAVYAVPIAILPVLQGIPERDGPDYDNIGLALARGGKGFAVDWDDPDFFASRISS